MKSWEVNDKNLQRWWSQCRDVSSSQVHMPAIYWRNVAYVLLRYLITGDDGTKGFERKSSSRFSRVLLGGPSLPSRLPESRAKKT